MEIAKTCILNGGSAESPSLLIKADDTTVQKPSAQVIQNGKEEFKKKDLVHNDWILNLHHRRVDYNKVLIFFLASVDKFSFTEKGFCMKCCKDEPDLQTCNICYRNFH
jgi:hypothetical protein